MWRYTYTWDAHCIDTVKFRHDYIWNNFPIMLASLQNEERLIQMMAKSPVKPLLDPLVPHKSQKQQKLLCASWFYFPESWTKLPKLRLVMNVRGKLLLSHETIYLVFNPVIHESTTRFRPGTMCLQGTPSDGFHLLYNVIIKILVILFFLYGICNGLIEGRMGDKLTLPLPKRRHDIYECCWGSIPICLMCWIQGAQICRFIFAYWGTRDGIFYDFRFIIQYPAVRFKITYSNSYNHHLYKFQELRRLYPLPSHQENLKFLRKNGANFLLTNWENLN